MTSRDRDRPRVAAVIPARLYSRRFPRKVLARDTGKYLLEHVWDRVVGCPGIDVVLVATDSREVLAAAESFGAEARMTSADHVSGTDRVAEVARGLDHDIVINVQGDEPFLEHSDLQTLIALFEDGAARESGAGAPVVMTTLAIPRTDPAGFVDPNVVKAVVAADGRALYFSRAPVPHVRSDAGGGASADETEWLQHVGLYAYRREFLDVISSLPPTALEKRERLEQLRVLENGYGIRVGRTTSPHIGVDTEEEYREFVAEYRRRASSSGD